MIEGCDVLCDLRFYPHTPGTKCKINFSGRGQNGEKDFGSTRVEKEEQFLQYKVFSQGQISVKNPPNPS